MKRLLVAAEETTDPAESPPGWREVLNEIAAEGERPGSPVVRLPAPLNPPHRPPGRPRLSSGVRGLDANLGGGIPLGSTLLLLDEPTENAATFCHQFIAEGLACEEPSLFVSLERTPDEVRERLHELGAPESTLTKLALVGAYAEGSTPAAGSSVFDEATPPAEPDPTRPCRIAFDSLTEAIDREGAEDALTGLRRLVRRMRTVPGVAVVTMVRGIHADALERRARNLADGILDFQVERQGFGVYPYVTIPKMRGVQETPLLIVFRSTDRGLTLESTRRVI